MDCLVCGFSRLFLITTRSFIEETKQRIADEVCVGYLFNRLNVRLCLLHNQHFFLPGPLLPLPRRYSWQSQRKGDLFQLSGRSCGWFFLNKAADGVTIISPTSVSTSLLSSGNWSSPNTESLGVAVMLCQQRALCHVNVDMHYLTNLSQCLALENTSLKGAVDLRQNIY